MVFLSADSPDQLPNDGYGFDFKDGKEKREEPLDEEDSQELFPDVTGRMPNGHFTHRFVWTEYPESEGVRILEGQTYEGVGCSGEIVGKISAATMYTEEMNESLQEAGDCLTQEIYEAMEALFDRNGKPKGTFKKKCQESIYCSILYVGGVYVKKDRRGHGLGAEILRALIHSLMHTRFLHVDLVLLCPASDPNPGPAAWSSGFDSLSSYFEKNLEFECCGGKNRRSGQSKYMFLEPDLHAEVLDFKEEAPVQVVASSSATPQNDAPATAASIVAPKNDLDDDAVARETKPAAIKNETAPHSAPSVHQESTLAAPTSVHSSDISASKRQKTS
jgi:hypothetical protein